MNAPPAVTTRDGASLARVLADALSLGLPGPDYITISPHVTAVSAIDFQFNASHGQDPVAALNAWAARFGVTVDVSADSKDSASTWHEFNFTHAGVMFHAYAKVRAAEDAPARDGYVTVDEAARHVAARLGATGDDEPLFDGPVTTKAELDKAYERADERLDHGVIATAPCTRPEAHGYQPGGMPVECDTAEHHALRIAPGESAGPASLASVQVQADGSVTAERPPTGYVAIPQEELRGARIGGQQ